MEWHIEQESRWWENSRDVFPLEGYGALVEEQAQGVFNEYCVWSQKDKLRKVLGVFMMSTVHDTFASHSLPLSHPISVSPVHHSNSLTITCLCLVSVSVHSNSLLFYVLISVLSSLPHLLLLPCLSLQFNLFHLSHHISVSVCSCSNSLISFISSIHSVSLSVHS
jgi:hypothetical protein